MDDVRSVRPPIAEPSVFGTESFFRNLARRWDGARQQRLVLTALVLLGIILRVLMSSNDLWLDEAWSLQLVSRIQSGWEVFYGISHDNNHFLNSIWMYWLGQDRSPWAYRVPSIGLGAVSIVSAYRLGARQNKVAAVIAALIMATAVPFVTYGSEARGYSGLIAASLIVFDLAESALESGRGWRSIQSWVLGAAAGFGALSHLTMAITVAGVAVASFMHLLRKTSVRQAAIGWLGLFAPMAVCLLPAFAALALGYLNRGGITIGNVSPATTTKFLTGYGRLIRFTVGLPSLIPSYGHILLAYLIVFAYGINTRRSLFRRDVSIVLCVIVPILLMIFRVPNIEFPRYYLPSGLILTVILSELLGIGLCSRSRLLLGASGAVLCLIGLTTFINDRWAIRLGRGNYGDVLTRMADRDRHINYSSDTPAWVEPVVTAASSRRGLRSNLVPYSDLCKLRPDWFVFLPEAGTPIPTTLPLQRPDCHIGFHLQEAILLGPMSGAPWAVYRRDQ